MCSVERNMTGRSGWAASAILLGLILPGTPAVSSAQTPSNAVAIPVSWTAALAPGSIHGVVHDETGKPIAGATVSAVGLTTTAATTDEAGRFDLPTFKPGQCFVRSHLVAFVAPPAPTGELLATIPTMSA